MYGLGGGRALVGHLSLKGRVWAVICGLGVRGVGHERGAAGPLAVVGNDCSRPCLGIREKLI